MPLREVCLDSRGNTLFVEDNGVGGRRYFSDEIGGGAIVWDTSLVSPEMMRLALEAEGAPDLCLMSIIEWWDGLPPGLRQDIEGSRSEPGAIARIRRAVGR